MAHDPKDRVIEPDLTAEDLYSPEYLRDCADGDARQERLEELKRRIELGAYRADPDSIAESLLSKGDLESNS
ncbi:MAG: flagellar biosynthesis anti-sigma factor FlgM [bacterium]|nr:flagellar biosynthesis anti-sigma factor FlgM [bacterium]